MCSVADDIDVAEVVFFRDDGEVRDGLLSIVTVGFSNDARFGNTVGDEVIASYAALRVFVAGFFASQGDEGGSEALVVEGERVPQAVTQDRGRSAVILSGAEDGDGICSACLIVAGVIADLQVNMGDPQDGSDKGGDCEKAENAEAQAKITSGPVTRGWRLARLGSHSCSARAMACVGMAPSRRICHCPSPAERSTMVVGRLRGVGPPSTMRGMRSPIWSRTQAA